MSLSLSQSQADEACGAPTMAAGSRGLKREAGGKKGGEGENELKIPVWKSRQSVEWGGERCRVGWGFTLGEPRA